MRAPLTVAIQCAFLAVASVCFVWVALDFTLGLREGSWWSRHLIEISTPQMVKQVAVMGAVVWLGVFLALYL